MTRKMKAVPFRDIKLGVFRAAWSHRAGVRRADVLLSPAWLGDAVSAAIWFAVMPAAEASFTLREWVVDQVCE